MGKISGVAKNLSEVMLYLTALNGWLVIQTIIFVIALLTGKLQMGFDGMKLQLITLYDIFISV